MQMTETRQLRDHYALLRDLWASLTEGVGDPGEDLRLLAVLPANVVSAALERAALPDGAPLSAVQAFHVGLIYNIAKRIQHTRGGGEWDAWKDISPFGSGSAPMEIQATAKAEPGNLGSERKFKMIQILDQGDGVNNVGLKGAKGGHLATDGKGDVASKSDIVKAWSKAVENATTGHSARRLGALQYIRKGWDISQVGYLGRWKSNVIMDYAQEALHGVNGSQPSKNFSPSVNDTKFGDNIGTLTDLLHMSKHMETKEDLHLTQRLQAERLQVRCHGHEGSSISSHEESGGEGKSILPISSSSGQICTSPSHTQKLKDSGTFALISKEDDLWMVLLFCQLSISRG